MDKITTKQLDELHEAFSLFDKDNDVCITSDELLTVMRNMRLKVTEKEIKKMIKRVDVDGNGTVDFEEFLKMMNSTRKNQTDEEKRRSQEQEMRQAFKVFDIDSNGLIDATELRSTMHNLGVDLSEVDVKAMIKAADKNRDGKIDYEEFIRMMYGK